jgi:hypothetical protein
MQQNRISAIFETLARYEVEFLVVGGVAAVLQGAPISTFDVDVVDSTAIENVARILTALEELDARYRFRPELRPSASHLASPGRQLLLTRLGPLDILGTIGRGRSYSDLFPLTDELDAGSGVCIRVLALEAQIAVKEEVGGEKDAAMLPLLRKTLQESRSGKHTEDD